MERLDIPTLVPVYSFVFGLTQVSTFSCFMGFSGCNFLKRKQYLWDYISKNEILECFKIILPYIYVGLFIKEYENIYTLPNTFNMRLVGTNIPILQIRKSVFIRWFLNKTWMAHWFSHYLKCDALILIHFCSFFNINF